jgi:hypothetical protein
MDQRDHELLDRQLDKLTPPRHDGVLIVTIVAMFFIGMTLGGFLSARESPALQVAANDAAAMMYPQGPPTAR